MSTTTTKKTLGDFGADMVWFTSVGIPTGTEVRFTGIDDETTGELYDDPDANLPFDFDLEGTVNAAGDEWAWDGEGEPLDWNRNTVLAIKAFKEG